VGLDDCFTFGKHKDEQLEDVLEDDKEYVIWLAENTETHFDEEVLERLNRG